MRVVPLLVARPPKARAVDVTTAPSDAGVDPAGPAGAFRPVVAGPESQRRAALEQLLADGSLTRDTQPAMFVYRVVHEGRRWAGVVCGVDTRDVVHLMMPHAASDDTRAAEAELIGLGWQVEPAVVRCQIPEAVFDLIVGDTNERPAYHFVAAHGATHSAWLVRDAAAYADAFAGAVPHAVLRGAARLMATHLAGVPALAVLTRDFDGETQMPAPLAPRSGLFVVPHEPR